MLNENLTLSFKITAKRHLRNLCAIRLKITKYKTDVIKKPQSDQTSQYYGLSYDETLIISNQIVPKVKITCSCFH